MKTAELFLMQMKKNQIGVIATPTFTYKIKMLDKIKTEELPKGINFDSISIDDVEALCK